MRSQLFSGTSEVVANTQDSLAAMLWTAGKLEEAETLARQGLSARRRIFTNEHPNAAVSLNNLANVLGSMGSLQESEDTHREALTMRRKLLGQDHIQTAISLFNCANVLCLEGKLIEAREMARECLSIFEKKTPQDWRRFGAQSLLGGILFTEKKYAEAEPLLLAGYEGMHQRENTISTDGKRHLIEAATMLKQLYTETHRQDRVAEWEQKLTTLSRIKPVKPVANPNPSVSGKQ